MYLCTHERINQLPDRVFASLAININQDGGPKDRYMHRHAEYNSHFLLPSFRHDACLRRVYPSLYSSYCFCFASPRLANVESLQTMSFFFTSLFSYYIIRCAKEFRFAKHLRTQKSALKISLTYSHTAKTTLTT